MREQGIPSFFEQDLFNRFMILSNLPTLFGVKGAWMLLALKIAAALGFIMSANLVILYAC